MFNAGDGERKKYFCHDHQCYWAGSLGEAIHDYFTGHTTDYFAELKRAKARLKANPEARILGGYRGEQIINAGRKALRLYRTNNPDSLNAHPEEFFRNKEIHYETRSCVAFLYKHGYLDDMIKK